MLKYAVIAPFYLTLSVIAVAEVRPAPSLDEIYRNSKSSVVWIHRVDARGQRVDTGLGFVIGQDRVATAFQIIDGATGLDVEFDDGRVVQTGQLWAWNRLEDWAVVKAATSSVRPLVRGDEAKALVGESLITFRAEAGPRQVIAKVDFIGVSKQGAYGERLSLAPNLALEDAGAPLLDPNGKVVGVIGGSTKPGARVGGRVFNLSPAGYEAMMLVNSASPISRVQESAGLEPASLTSLMLKGVLTPQLLPVPEITYGGSTNAIPARSGVLIPPDVRTFSRTDPAIHIYTIWMRKDKINKGTFSARVYDSQNVMRLDLGAQAIIFGKWPSRVLTRFSPTRLEAGTYRIDVLLDEHEVWRTFVQITN